jgi:hypothetical protein
MSRSITARANAARPRCRSVQRRCADDACYGPNNEIAILPFHLNAVIALMRRHLRSSLIIFGLTILGSAAAAAPRNPAPARSVPAIDRSGLAGSWNGTWTGGNSVYNAVMTLDVDASGNIDGTINWISRSTPSPNGKDKIGMRAIEYVRGEYYPETEAIVLDGYRKDDPTGIWEADKYRLTIAPTHETMGGITRNTVPGLANFFSGAKRTLRTDGRIWSQYGS